MPHDQFTSPSPALAHYLPAFEKDVPFLHSWRFEDGEPVKTSLTRGAFLELAIRAARLLCHHGLSKGDCAVHCFGENSPLDLVFRFASILTGTVPVTVNWQADTLEQVLFKIDLTGARLLLHDAIFHPDYLSTIAKDRPDLTRLAIDDEAQWSVPRDVAFTVRDDIAIHDPRIVIFTSGTTGHPKGVCHTYRSYSTNRETFDSFLTPGPGRLAAVTVNPMHHANTTAISDWCLRRPHAELHLISRYTTGYWRVLAEVTEQRYDKVIAPAVSRHFDFLENLDQNGQLPIPDGRLKQALASVTFLIGSAPVGPSTVKRLLHYTGRVPTVRFGSTETCLQVMGIPGAMDDATRRKAFERGWAHGEGQTPGYYIGRPHPPFTEVEIVAAIQPDRPDFMKARGEGEPGYIVTRGANLMHNYVNNPEATEAVFAKDWYTGLQDIGFFLTGEDGERDFYWMSRESHLLIKGGANHAYDQINHELTGFVCSTYGLTSDQFDLAVVGLNIDSEHEDSCCVTLQADEAPSETLAALKETFIERARNAVGKGSKPDYFRIGPIPRNFKGAIKVPDLKQAWRDHLSRQA